ncbi:MAG: zinc ribbon domain-containing protein [Bacteroidaceae bacterium]
MKCSNCGYEIESSNLKTCPLCGSALVFENNDVPSTTQTGTAADEPREVEKPETISSDVNNQAEVQVVCPQCNEYMVHKTKFCPNCGFDFQKQENQVQEPVQAEAEPLPSEPVVWYVEEAPDDVMPKQKPQMNEPEIPAHDELDAVRHEDDEEEELQMGGYYPYPEDDPEAPAKKDQEKGKGRKTFPQWLKVALAVLLSVMIGAFLYSVTH